MPDETPTMRDYYADGHCIGATSITEAREWCEALYGHSPASVRLWRESDNG